MKKSCCQCEVEQRVMDYYRQSNGGFMSICKACHRANVKANREANADYYREYERGRATLPHRVEARNEYAQTTEGKAAHIRAHRRQKALRPARRNARVIVGNALRDGRLSRHPCEVCGKGKAQAHHDDYSKPLGVRWLCTTHHAEWHKHNTPICPDQEQAA